MTNYYFESDDQNDFLHKEVSKEHRPNPIADKGMTTGDNIWYTVNTPPTKDGYVWTRDHIEAHFLTCFIALTIARILETKLENKYSIGRLLDSLSKADCTLIQQNYYLFDYYDHVLKDIGKVLDINFSKRIRTLGEIKKVLASTKK